MAAQEPPCAGGRNRWTGGRLLLVRPTRGWHRQHRSVRRRSSISPREPGKIAGSERARVFPEFAHAKGHCRDSGPEHLRAAPVPEVRIRDQVNSALVSPMDPGVCFVMIVRKIPFNKPSLTGKEL